MSSSKVKVTTTSSFDGVEIIEYLEPVTSHVIVGMNIFRDMFATMTDFFGGNSRAYHKILTSINDRAIAELKQRAYDLGGNCVLGLKIDNDEISGGGKSMMMVTAVGTAAIARFEKTVSATPSGKRHALDSEALQILREKKKYKEALRNGTLTLDDDFWSFLKNDQIADFADDLIQAYADDQSYYALQFDFSLNREKLFDNLQMMEADELSDLVHHQLHESDLDKLPTRLFAIINEFSLMSFQQVNRFLDSDELKRKRLGVRLLSSPKSTYTQSDVALMETLVERLRTEFPSQAKKLEKTKLLSSRSYEVWECACGQENDLENTHCAKCHKDEYGFDQHMPPLNVTISKLQSDLELLKREFFGV